MLSNTLIALPLVCGITTTALFFITCTLSTAFCTAESILPCDSSNMKFSESMFLSSRTLAKLAANDCPYSLLSLKIDTTVSPLSSITSANSLYV